VFVLSGKRLKGRFTLLKFERTGPNGWLLLKAKD